MLNLVTLAPMSPSATAAWAGAPRSTRQSKAS